MGTYVPHEKQIDPWLTRYYKPGILAKALEKKLTTEEKQAKCKHDGKIDIELGGGIRVYSGTAKYCHKCNKFLGFLTEEEEKEYFKSRGINFS